MRENRRPGRSGRGASYRRDALSGAHESFVTSPDQTRSQSEVSASAPSSPVASRSSLQKTAPSPRSAARIATCAAPSGEGSADGWPTRGASSRKNTATRSRPAPTQTSSPDAQKASRSACRNPGTLRGSTSLSQRDTGSASPWSGTSASRSVCRLPIPCHEGRKRPNASCPAGSTSRLSAASVARRIRLQDVGITPLTLDPAGPELATHESAVGLERRELALDEPVVEPEPISSLAGREGPAGPREPPESRRERVLDRLEEHCRNSSRRSHAEGVADEPGVLDRREQLQRTEPDTNRAPLAQERLRESRGRTRPRAAARLDGAGRAARRHSSAGVGATPRPRRSRPRRAAREAPRSP